MTTRIDMKTFLIWLLGVALFFVVLIFGTYFGMRREDIPYAALEKAYSNATSKFVDLPSGVRAHYRIDGKQDGRTLVLIHGYGVSLESWTAWISELRSDFRLVSVDLPGHGLTRSPADYAPWNSGFVDFIDEFTGVMGLTRFVIVGNGSGGNAAWRFALRRPERLEAMVLISPFGWPHGDKSNPLVVELFSNPKIQPLLIEIDPSGMVQNGLNSAYENKALVTDRMISRYSEMARAPGHRRILGTLMLERDRSLSATGEKLATIKAPTLILWGNKDALAPVGDAKRFSDAISGSKMIVYDGIGHMVHEETPAKSATDLKAFLAEHSTGGDPTAASKVAR